MSISPQGQQPSAISINMAPEKATFQRHNHDGGTSIDSGPDVLQGMNISPQGQQPSAISVNMPPDAPEDPATAAQNLEDMHELWTAWHSFSQRKLKGDQVLFSLLEALCGPARASGSVHLGSAKAWTCPVLSEAGRLLRVPWKPLPCMGCDVHGKRA